MKKNDWRFFLALTDPSPRTVSSFENPLLFITDVNPRSFLLWHRYSRHVTSSTGQHTFRTLPCSIRHLSMVESFYTLLRNTYETTLLGDRLTVRFLSHFYHSINRFITAHINNLYNTVFWALVQQGGQTTREAHATLRVSWFFFGLVE